MTVHFCTVSTINLSNIVTFMIPIRDGCGLEAKNLRRSLSYCEVSVTPEPTDRLPVRSRLEKAISELQGLHELLHTGELDPQILADFRDALNRVRNTEWAAQQYANRKASDPPAGLRPWRRLTSKRSLSTMSFCLSSSTGSNGSSSSETQRTTI